MANRLRQLADELTRLPDEELLPVVQQALRNRTPFPEETGTDRYFIGLASQVDANEDGPNREGDWEISAIAEVDMEQYSEGALGTDLFVGPDWGCCQGGVCENCGIEARSNMKHGICSICHGKVYLT